MSVPVVSPDGVHHGNRRLPSNTISSLRKVDNKQDVTPAVRPSNATFNPIVGMHSRYSTQLNEQLTSAQRVLQFVDTLSNELDSLKSDLSQELTKRRIDTPKLEAKIADFAKKWEQHYAKSGGGIDSRLRLCLTAEARQTFTIRGLDLAKLTSGPRETLVFFPTGQGNTAPCSVNVGGDISEGALLRSFKYAFAPQGINVDVNDTGELSFSVREPNWQKTREQFAMRGGGIRFPAGQAHAVQVQAGPDAFAIATWQVSEHSELRQTLQRVLRAQLQVQQVRATIVAAIDEIERSIRQLAYKDEHIWAGDFVADFNARFNQPTGYRDLYDVIPTTLNMNRFRVLSLLTLV